MSWVADKKFRRKTTDINILRLGFPVSGNQWSMFWARYTNRITVEHDSKSIPNNVNFGIIIHTALVFFGQYFVYNLKRYVF